MPKVYHAVHTNAYDGSAAGFRTIFLVPSDWPESGKEYVDRWLRGLAPRPGDDTGAGVAVDCFKLGEVIYFCLAMVETEFARDEHGRTGGFLVHGLILPLEEGCPCGDFGSALLELRRSFEPPKCADLERLAVYLEQCRENSEVMPRPADLRWILAFGEEFWSHFFAVVTTPRKEVVWPADLSSDFPMDFLRVSALVPPRLRLAFRWSFELAAVSPKAVPIRLGSRQELREPQKSSLSEVYWDWLRSCVNQGEPELVYQLAESWAINSWDDLEREIRTMAKKRGQQKEAALGLREQPAAKPAAGLNDLKRIEKSVKSYVDQRLEGLDPSGVSSGSGWYRRWRTEIWGVPILAWLVVLTLRSGGGGLVETAPSGGLVGQQQAGSNAGSGGARTGSAEAGNERKALSTTSMEKIISNASAEWAKYVREHGTGVAGLLQAAADGTRLAKEVIDPAAAKKLDELASRLTKDGGLESEDLIATRKGLFEYVIRRWQAEAGSSSISGKIDLALKAGEYPTEEIRAFFSEHRIVGVPERFLVNPHESLTLQTLVVITWLERPTQ